MGLGLARQGVIVVSRDFLARSWTEKEMVGLVARRGRSSFVWHGVGQREVSRSSAILAGLGGISSEGGLTEVVEEVVRACQPAKK